jgi:hypothetical protein
MSRIRRGFWGWNCYRFPLLPPSPSISSRMCSFCCSHYLLSPLSVDPKTSARTLAICNMCWRDSCLGVSIYRLNWNKVAGAFKVWEFRIENKTKHNSGRDKRCLCAPKWKGNGRNARDRQVRSTVFGLVIRKRCQDAIILTKETRADKCFSFFFSQPAIWSPMPAQLK